MSLMSHGSPCNICQDILVWIKVEHGNRRTKISNLKQKVKHSFYTFYSDLEIKTNKKISPQQEGVNSSSAAFVQCKYKDDEWAFSQLKGS